jgi:hypothetical protein
VDCLQRDPNNQFQKLRVIPYFNDVGSRYIKSRRVIVIRHFALDRQCCRQVQGKKALIGVSVSGFFCLSVSLWHFKKTPSRLGHCFVQKNNRLWLIQRNFDNSFSVVLVEHITDIASQTGEI